MKKTLAALIGILYLYSFTLCLCNAAAVGEVHPVVSAAVAPSPAQGGDEQGACAHHGQADDQDQPHHGRGTSDNCCIKFLQDTPGLLPDLSEKPLSISYSSLHFLPASTFHLDTWQNASLFKNHSPPGLVLQDPLRSLLSPRAPPLSA